MKKESSNSVLIGTIKTLSNGSAIVLIENTFMEDVLILKNDLNGAFNHDQVEIQIMRDSQAITLVFQLDLRPSDV